MSIEMTQKVEYSRKGKWLVSNELFLDLIFNDKCNCDCKFCIAKTPTYAEENYDKWVENIEKTFEIFDIRNVIILGGEATIDRRFFDKLQVLERVVKGKNVDNIILTTNGIMFRSKDFIERLKGSCVNTVNMSVMNYDKEKNDSVMCGNTLSREEIKRTYDILKQNNRTMRLNVNVFKDNCDTVEEMKNYVDYFNGCADIIKFSPLMPTNMFCTVHSVTEYTNKMSLSKDVIRKLYDDFAKEANILIENKGVFGLVEYKEVDLNGQKVILKYAQVEDTYDLDRVIPTLKLYSNGALSNEWNYKKNILENLG